VNVYAVPRLLIVPSLLLAACAGGGQRTEVTEMSPLEGALELPVGHTMTITADARIEPGDYFRPASGGEPVLLLEGLRGVELDLTGVHIFGQAEGAELDEARGVGVLVRDCEDLTLRGGHLSGYRVGLLIEGSRDVRVEGLEVTDYFATRLLGAPGRAHAADRIELADASDWLSDYGAAIAVRSSSRVVLRGTRSRHGQNGVLLIGSQGCELSGSDHSFLSGWGVALTDSVGCTISNNRFDACARGLSGDAPPDGLGAAGIALAAACERNVISHNVARSCGDGMRVEGDGAGGAGNLWFGNDFSGPLASAGIVHNGANERLIGNRLSGGEWRGLHITDSTGVVVYGNEIEGVRGTGISLVSSRDCLLVGNQVVDCDLALLVRGHEVGDGYDSEGHWIVDNDVAGSVQDVVLERARAIVFDGNRFQAQENRISLDGLTAVDAEGEPAELWSWLKSEDSGSPSGRATDVELARAEGPRPAALEALSSFDAPDAAASEVDWSAIDAPLDVHLGRFTPWDPNGPRELPRTSVQGGLLSRIGWEASWFLWDEATDPRGDLERWRALRFTPRARRTVTGWEDPWGGQMQETVGDRNFGLHATATLQLFQAGTYLLSARSDDGLRILVDGEVVLESWTWKPATEEVAQIELSSGTHDLILEYFQIDGPAVLQLSLDPARDGSTEPRISSNSSD